MLWRCRDRLIDLSRPQVMGILNVTPDSFSDGGRYADVEAALQRAEQIAAEGAAIIDVGGESTRPGAAPVSEALEMERVLPVIEALAGKLDIAISIDTSKPAVMAAAVAAGACIINDIRALQAPGARTCAAQTRAGVCLMHMQGEPSTMQVSPHYNDVTAEVTAFLRVQLQACSAEGIDADAVVIDPGIGFGKTLEHSLALLRELPRFGSLGVPVLVGVSRKSIIGRILGKRDLHERLYGGLGLAALAVSLGARIVRTHDVGATVDAVRMVDAVMQGAGP
jgi:dihydropteroate synthase